MLDGWAPRVMWSRVKRGLGGWRGRHCSAARVSLGAAPLPPTFGPPFKGAAERGLTPALRDDSATYSYGGLLASAVALSHTINRRLPPATQERVATLTPNDASYVIAQWAVWISGHIAVPLSPHHPSEVKEYFMKDSEAKLAISSLQYEEELKALTSKLGREIITLDEAVREEARLPDSLKVSLTDQKEDRCLAEKVLFPDVHLPDDAFYRNNQALILYTAGNSLPPKGVVLSHYNLYIQSKSLIDALRWTEKDTLLSALPLHHSNAVVNGLLVPFYAGGKCVLQSVFDPPAIWSELLGLRKQSGERVNAFLGVPMMYNDLIKEYDRSLNKSDKMADYIKQTCSSKIRLMMSSAALLPQVTASRWEEITGHQIVDRYGTTESGVILSSPVEGLRVQGSVGIPVPGVQARILSEDGSDTVICETSCDKGTVVTGLTQPIVGHLQVKGEGLFKCYHEDLKSTREAFTKDGWFKTDDIVQYKQGTYWVMGRKTTDIIKSGGFKVSSLQVESVLMDSGILEDVAVLGLPDPSFGQKVVAVVHLKKNESSSEVSFLKEWSRSRLPTYANPVVYRVVPFITRNAMGKLDKVELAKNLFQETQATDQQVTPEPN